MAEEYFGFKKNEIRDIIVTAIFLGFLFSFYPGFLPEGFTWFHNFVSATLMVLLSLFVHHIGHKLRASRIEAVSEYKLIPQFILLAIFMTFFTGVMVGAGGIIVFAALGFVTIRSRYSPRIGYRWIRITRKEIGEIAWAGPIANIGLAMVFKLLEPINPAFFNYGATMNLMIAVFHLFPIPPLDGSLVAGWSPMAWLSTIIPTFILLFLVPYISFLMAVIILAVTMLVIFSIMQRSIPHPG